MNLDLGAFMSRTSSFIGKDGQRLTYEEAEAKLTDRSYKVILQEVLRNGLWISSVWLGLDHRFAGHGPPLIFETMVFVSRDNLEDLACARASSEAEACANHSLLATRWQEVVPRTRAPRRLKKRLKREGRYALWFWGDA